MTLDQARKLKAGESVYVSVCMPGTPIRVRFTQVARDHLNASPPDLLMIRDGSFVPIENVHLLYQQARDRICEILRNRIASTQRELEEWSKAS